MAILARLGGAICLLVAVLHKGVHAVDYDSFQFGPTYDEYDEESGERLASKNFHLHGDARAHASFVRLTPDRQGKSGAVWSKGPTESSSLSAVMEFRISGQGKRLFGDGIAVWLVEQSYFSSGSFHGFNEYFKGLGVVVDTYRNAGDKAHRDISLVVNDGERDYTQVVTDKDDVVGCNAKVRYHAKASDFNAPFNTSRLMVNVVGRTVSVMVDERATGEWEQCFNYRLDVPALGSDWLTRSHVGVTSSTGDLADNHDVISFATFGNPDTAKASLSAVRSSTPGWIDDTPLEGMSKKQKLLTLEDRMTAFLQKLDLTEHHLEHEMIRLRDGLDHMLEKIDNNESDMLLKIQHVEELMYMDSELDGYMNSYGGSGVDDDYYNPAMSRQAEILSHFRARLDETTSSHKEAIEEAITQIKEGGSDWRNAYALILFEVIVGIYAGYQFFRYALLHHLF
jgi:mannose-binding lectin 2